MALFMGYLQNKKSLLLFCVMLGTLFCGVSGVHAQRIMERLDRGLIAMSKGSGQIYIGWRLLGNDPADISFNLYQSISGGGYTKINALPMRITTDTVLQSRNLAASHSFYVMPVLGGVEQPASKTFSVQANAPVRNYLSSIPLKPIQGGFFRSSTAMSGDADGDGEYELYVFRKNFYAGTPGAGESTGDTSRMVLDCYKLNGSFLWRFEFGPNINCSDEHNAEAYYVVADFDGDGRAEVCVRGSERSVFQAASSQRRMVGDVLKPDGITLYPFDPNGSMQRTAMPEYLFVLNGLTGAPLDSIPYQPALNANPFSYWGGNERPFYQWMSIAYLDGKYPSIVTQRGIGDGQPVKVYGWDFRNGHLTMRRDSFVTTSSSPDISFGGHSIRIRDIDNDGKDEVILTAAVIDHDMKLIYSQSEKGIAHGDEFQVLDIDPDRPGLEFFAIQQSNPQQLGAALWDAASGTVINKLFTTQMSDPSRGDAASIVPTLKGAQYYGGTPGVMDRNGTYVNRQSFTPCATAYWDADLAKELVYNDYTRMNSYIQKYDAATGNVNNILGFKAEGCESRTMSGPTMIGDILGDWREEILFETADQSELRIYTTTIPSANRIYTLMHNPGYRVQTTCLGRIGGFSVDYYLGPQMGAVPASPFAGEDIRWSGSSPSWDINTTPAWFANNATTTYQQGNRVLFDHYGSNGTVTNTSVTLSGSLSPGAVSVLSGIDYTFEGTGQLTGTMALVKNGKGTLRINNAHSFTGITTIWDGALFINNIYSSPVFVRGGVWSGVNAQGNTGARFGGTGTLRANLTVDEKGAITPGMGMGSAGTLTVQGNVLLKKASYVAFDISNTSGGAKDQLSIDGNLTIQDTIYLFLNKLNGVPAAGDYPLISYTGEFSGTLGLIITSGLEGILHTLYLSGKTLGIRISSSRAPSDLIWGGTSGNWDLGITQAWLNSSAADVFVANDRVTFNNTGIVRSDIDLKVALPASSWNVASTGDYTFSGNGYISGSASLNKTGTGKLTLRNNNTFTGAVSLTGGVTEINSINDYGIPGCFGAPSSGAIFIDGGTLRVAETTVFTNRLVQLGSLGATFDIADSKFPLLLSALVSGVGSIVKNGAGALLLSSANTFSGGLTINEGDVSLTGATANASGLGSGSVVLNGGSLNMSNVQASETAPWNLVVPSGRTARLFPDGRCYLTGTLTGGGTLNILIPYIRTEFKGNWSAFTGTINLTYDPHYASSDFRINNNSGYAQTAFYLTQAAAMYRVTSGSVTVGSVSGIAGAELATTDGASHTTNWIVGTRNLDATFSGLISGPGTVTKTGSGIWTLSGANTLSGIFTINDGKLMATNTTGSATGTGLVPVTGTGTLAGTGFIAGEVTLFSGSSMEPGNGTIGTLTINNHTTLLPGSTLKIEINKSGTTTMDHLVLSSGTLTLNGNLNLTRLGVNNYVAGDNFKIITAPKIRGKFASNFPSVPGINMVWDTTQMASDGIIRIMGVQAITFSPLPDPLYGNAPVTLSATGGASGIPVVFSSSNSSVATVNGNSLLIVGSGTCIITASQAGNSNYFSAADISQTLSVLVTGIEDIDSEFKVYPNPVKDKLYVSTNEALNGIFELCNAAGIKFKSGKIVPALTEIDMSDLSSGLYILRISNGTQTSVTKVLKQ